MSSAREQSSPKCNFYFLSTQATDPFDFKKFDFKKLATSRKVKRMIPNACLYST